MANLKSFLAFIFVFSSVTVCEAKYGLVQTPKGPRFSFYEKKDDYYITEWDILVEPVSKRRKGDEKANHRRFGKWKNATIPFEIDPSIPSQNRILGAIDYFHENTSIKLVPRTNEKDYVYFKFNGNEDCSSFIGRKGGKQNINVPNWCSKGSIIHEILHALGFNHEQSRPDRWKFIKIHWANIKFKKIKNFFLSPFAKKYGAFDFESIMLYPSFNSFAKDPSRPTMSFRRGGTWTSQRERMSQQDLEALEKFYK